MVVPIPPTAHVLSAHRHGRGQLRMGERTELSEGEQYDQPDDPVLAGENLHSPCEEALNDHGDNSLVEWMSLSVGRTKRSDIIHTVVSGSVNAGANST